MYIGRIPPDCGNVFMTALLGSCGTYLRWRRSDDAETGKPKSFGYCDYDTIDGARRVSAAVCLCKRVCACVRACGHAWGLWIEFVVDVVVTGYVLVKYVHGICFYLS